MTSIARKYFAPTASQKPTVGDTKLSMINNDHLGWIRCDGRSLKITDYQFLFNVLGNSYGGQGTEYFNLPNPAGRVLGVIGSGSGLTSRAMGASVGEETHVLSIAEMPTHNHTVTDPGHIHTGTTDAAGFGTGTQNVNTLTTQDGAADNSGNHTHSFTTAVSTTGLTINNTGGSNAHNNMQPTMFIGNMFVYSGYVGRGTYPLTIGYNIY